MMWLLFPVGLFLFRGKIASFIAPYVPVLSPQKTSFYGHVVTLCASIVYVLPIEFLGLGMLKRPAYMLSLWSTILNAMMTIKANYGFPQLPENVSFSNITQACTTSIQPWLQKVMMGGAGVPLPLLRAHIPDGVSIGRAAGDLGPPIVVVSVHILLEEHADESLVAEVQAYMGGEVEAKEKEVQLYSALAEIGFGIYLAVSVILPTRQLLVTVLYWNFLQNKYRVPRSHDVHLQAWRLVGQRVEPLTKALPFLQKPLGMAKDYFTGGF
eukprot:CAMPEP_0117519608 /NCGR_PEP_ID=MMETSP0784-20121206/32737_1 /TAXON_ID=39447 /ORGANISM="" /LENGTH=267 /DNA_ID=CAMNT_0005315569 /DNA_START=129 /DNA_END=932 /DNA_ORIENTATION=-